MLCQGITRGKAIALTVDYGCIYHAGSQGCWGQISDNPVVGTRPGSITALYEPKEILEVDPKTDEGEIATYEVCAGRSVMASRMIRQHKATE